MSYITNPVAERNLSSSDRAKFFAWCFAAVYAVAAIVAVTGPVVLR